MLTVITEDTVTTVPGEPGPELWLDADSMTKATGWTLKPEGLCRDDTCVPVPANRRDEFVRDDRINASAFWQLLGRPAAASKDGDLWSLGEDANARNEALHSLQAPDFTLPDFNGQLHSLHDFQRQRVLLITWASW